MSRQWYRVLSDTSTRASVDPESPDYETWLHFPAGTLVKRWPAHAPVEEWVASGHWAPTPLEEPPAESEPEETA